MLPPQCAFHARWWVAQPRIQAVVVAWEPASVLVNEVSKGRRYPGHLQFVIFSEFLQALLPCSILSFLRFARNPDSLYLTSKGFVSLVLG